MPRTYLTLWRYMLGNIESHYMKKMIWYVGLTPYFCLWWSHQAIVAFNMLASFCETNCLPRASFNSNATRLPAKTVTLLCCNRLAALYWHDDCAQAFRDLPNEGQGKKQLQPWLAELDDHNRQAALSITPQFLIR